MALITTSRATERLSRRLQRHGIDQWIVESDHSASKYLRLDMDGRYLGPCGWTLRQAAEIVDHMIEYRDCDDPPPISI